LIRPGRSMSRRIAVFDYRMIADNPVGGCHLRLLRGLCEEYDFTVFAVEFDNPCPERIRFVRASATARPPVCRLPPARPDLLLGAPVAPWDQL
jgi:hypothetical protein